MMKLAELGTNGTHKVYYKLSIPDTEGEIRH